MNLRSLLDAARGGRLDTLVEDNVRLRRPLPLARRITFCALAGGVGCTSTAVGVAQVYTSRRAAPLLLVDAGGSHNSLRRLAGIDDDAWSRLVVDDPARENPVRLAEAVSGLPQAGPLTWVLDVRAVLQRDAMPTVDGWSQVLEPLSRFPDIVASDLGCRTPEEIRVIAERSQITCLVTGPGREDLDAAAAVVRLIRRDGHQAHLCVVAPTKAPQTEAIRIATRDLPVTPVVLTRDAGRLRSSDAGGAWLRSNQARLIRLAADLIGDSAASPRRSA